MNVTLHLLLSYCHRTESLTPFPFLSLNPSTEHPGIQALSSTKSPISSNSSLQVSFNFLLSQKNWILLSPSPQGLCFPPALTSGGIFILKWAHTIRLRAGVSVFLLLITISRPFSYHTPVVCWSSLELPCDWLYTSLPNSVFGNNLLVAWSHHGAMYIMETDIN